MMLSVPPAKPLGNSAVSFGRGRNGIIHRVPDKSILSRVVWKNFARGLI